MHDIVFSFVFFLHNSFLGISSFGHTCKPSRYTLSIHLHVVFFLVRLTGKLTYPIDIDCNQCNRSDIKDFTLKCIDLGIQYMGLCCGNAPHYTRTMAETLGRKPRASRYSPNMSLSVVFGTSDKIRRNSSKLYSRGTLELENNNACQ